MVVVMKIRKQGGARIVTLPNSVLASVGADTGTPLAFETRDGAIIATPMTGKPKRKRYTLSELLVGSEHAAALNEETAWAREGDPIGREII